MRSTAGRISLGIATLLLLSAVHPAGEGEVPEARVGVALDGVSTMGLPPNAKAERIGPPDLTPAALRGLDALVVDAAVLEEAWGDAARHDALRAFVADGRALVLVGDPVLLARTVGVVLPAGGDVPWTEHGPAPVAAVAHGAYRGASGVAAAGTFAYATEQDFRERAAADVAEWLLGLPDFEPRAGKPFTASASDPGNWQYWGSTSYTYTWNPYGRIGYVAHFRYAILDGSTSWDWWVVEMRQTTTPGRHLWGNNWRTNVGWVTSLTKDLQSSNELSTWGPPSTDATGQMLSVTYKVGMRQGVDGATLTSEYPFGYTLDDMLLTQASSSSTDFVYVRHEFGYASTPANGPWTNSPGWSVRVNEPLCLKIPWQNKAEWRRYDATGNDVYYTTWINTWRELCK